MTDPHGPELNRLLMLENSDLRARLAAVEALCDEKLQWFRDRFDDPVAAALVEREDVPVMIYEVRAALREEGGASACPLHGGEEA